VGSDLTVGASEAIDAAYPVTLLDGEQASGLADMLHQFLSQNLEEWPKKVRQARRLDGTLMFRSAEDTDICVRITFFGDKIEIEDDEGEVRGEPSITSDFLSTAHLTTGEESPFGLLLKRKIRVRFRFRHIWFLLRVLRFMQIPAEAGRRTPAWVRWALAFVLIGALAALLWFAVLST